MPRKLAEYQRKRDFTKTAEPSGKDTRTSKNEPLHFVIQKHDASHLHWDLRLELDGVMLSWAVPKGPSLDPSVKRLAMQVEDHPISYNAFEGTIPKGEYGGGTVMLWDRGTYTPDEPDPDGPEAAVRAGIKAGKLAFTLHGHVLHGSFALVRTRPRGNERSSAKPQWLLIKHKDAYADPGSDITATALKSVATGRTMPQITAAKAPPTKTVPAKAAPAKAKKVVKAPDLTPMLASTGSSVPPGTDWEFEPKYDGVRVLAFATPTSTALITRNGIDRAHHFPAIADAATALAARRRAPLVLDGEIVALVDGAPGRFQALQKQMETDVQTQLMVFDLLVDGDDVLVSQPWTTRRKRLEQVMAKSATDSALQLSESERDGNAMLARAHKSGWEGVMAKRIDATYTPGVHSPAWRKLKIESRQEFVVGGFTEPRKSRVALGALLVGYYDGDRLVYAGHVGGGFTTAGLREMRRRLDSLERRTSPFDTTPPGNEPVHWVRPSVMVEVKFNQWTDEGRLRQPIYVGTRDDKDPRTVTREPMSLQKKAAPASNKVVGGKKKVVSGVVGRDEKDPVVRALREIEDTTDSGTVSLGTAKLDVTHLSKVFFPKQGFTKGDVLRYYAHVAKAIVPTTADRPLVLKRYPNGITGKFFFQQNAPPDTQVPRGVRVETVSESGEKVRRLVGGSLATLLYTVQLGAISVDPWHSRIQSLDTPDYTIIDLDPGDRAPFSLVVEVARYVKEQLDALGLHGAPKTSGASGIHIYIPLPPRTPADAATLLAQLVATRVATAHPKVATVERATKKRSTTAIYVDYLQNIVGKSVAGPYCVRAVDGAHVSAPLEWSELTPDLDRATFTIETMPARLAEHGDLWADAMRKRNTAAALRHAVKP
jgi:bifunctional non-homologous end joining protein LigD